MVNKDKITVLSKHSKVSIKFDEKINRYYTDIYCIYQINKSFNFDNYE